MPVRKIPKNYRNVTGVHASDKSIGDAQFESTLERDFITLLEFFPDVDRFEVQPRLIKWLDVSGKQHKHKGGYLRAAQSHHQYLCRP